MVRLHEKGGKEHAVPCHHALAEALHAYIKVAGIAEDRKGFLFRTAPGHKADMLSERPMDQCAAWHMIRRRAKAVGITAPIGNHTFRATGITAYLANGGALNTRRKWRRTKARARPSLTAGRKERLTQDEVRNRLWNNRKYRSLKSDGSTYAGNDRSMLK